MALPESQPDNPYSPSQIADTRTLASGDDEETARQYQLRMSWPARQNFLRAVGPLRLAAMWSAVLGMWGLFRLLQSFEYERARDMPALLEAATIANTLLLGARGVLALYMCWQSWKFADALALVAAGKSSSFEDWSALQLRLARLMIAALTLSLAYSGLDRLVFPYLMQSASPGDA